MKSGSLKNKFEVEIIHGSSCWIHLACFHATTTTQPPFRQVIHRQCSHCLFIFVFVFTSNPTLTGFSPPAGSVSAARFDVEPQFIRLSHWTLTPPPHPPPPLAGNMSQSIITWPTYLPPPAYCFSYSTPWLGPKRYLTHPCQLKNPNLLPLIHI